MADANCILFKLHYHLNNKCPTANISYLKDIFKSDRLIQVFLKTKTSPALCTSVKKN